MLTTKRSKGRGPQVASTVKSKAASAIDACVGERLRQRCLQLRISKTAVARAISVTIPQVIKYERGENRISAARLHKLAELLDVPIEWFFDRSNSGLTLGHQSDGSADGAALSDQLITVFRRLRDPADQELVVCLAKRLAKHGAGISGR